MKKKGRATKAIIALSLVVGAYITGAWFLWSGHSPSPQPTPTLETAEVKGSASSAHNLYPVTTRHPDVPRVLTGKNLPDGTPESVACGTCHATKPPNIATDSGDQLDEFHVGLKFAHGTLNCLSCHNADDYDSLRLADGRPVTFPNTMTLCAQCHGPQHRDYQNGSHGGMTGFWDRTKGPRQRNHCIDCHDPHAPAYPQMLPVFKPKDTGGHSLHE